MPKIRVGLMLFAFLVGCGLDGPIPAKREDAAPNSPASAKALNTPTPAVPVQQPKQADRVAATAKNSDEPASRQATNTWLPDTALLDKLAPADLDPVHHAYRLRPPLRWEFTPLADSSGPDGSRTFVGQWHKPGPIGVTKHCLLLLVVSEFPINLKARVVDYDRTFDAWVTRDEIQAKREPAEQGHIGDIDFVRYRWTGTKDGQRLRGVVYFAKDVTRMLRFAVISPADGHDAAIRLAESAVLTLQKP
jgi:hypothetical protein